LILPANDWQDVAPLLVVLACLSVFRPITWTLSAYMEAESKTNKLMFLELAKVGILIGGIALLAPYGVRAAAGAVGLAFGVTAVAGVALVVREGPSPRKLLVGFMQPLLACAVMAAAVLGVRALLATEYYALELVVMIVVGAVAYTVAAFAIAPSAARDLVQLARKALRKSA
jgi:O-antigen/teichoic acid export membrane protein